MTVTSSDPILATIQQKIAYSCPVLEELPAVAIINDIRDGSVIYMSARGLKALGTTLEELQAMGPSYHERFFNPEQTEEYVPEILELLASNDPSRIFTFFQQVRYVGHSEWQWHLTSVRAFVQDDEGKTVALLSVAHHLNSEHHYTRKIDRLIQEMEFLKSNLQTYKKLSAREREVLRHLALGDSTAAIAEKLFLSALTVETHRKNIRRKLNVHNVSELAQFARAFDLI
jgi:DNA-binding CsgD family transcriptional regulator